MSQIVSRSLKASQGVSRRLKASQGVSRRLKASQGVSKRLKASQGISKRLKASQDVLKSLKEIHKDSLRFLHTYLVVKDFKRILNLVYLTWQVSLVENPQLQLVSLLVSVVVFKPHKPSF